MASTRLSDPHPPDDSPPSSPIDAKACARCRAMNAICRYIHPKLVLLRDLETSDPANYHFYESGQLPRPVISFESAYCQACRTKRKSYYLEYFTRKHSDYPPPVKADQEFAKSLFPQPVEQLCTNTRRRAHSQPQPMRPPAVRTPSKLSVCGHVDDPTHHATPPPPTKIGHLRTPPPAAPFIDDPPLSVLVQALAHARSVCAPVDWAVFEKDPMLEYALGRWGRGAAAIIFKKVAFIMEHSRAGRLWEVTMLCGGDVEAIRSAIDAEFTEVGRRVIRDWEGEMGSWRDGFRR